MAEPLFLLPSQAVVEKCGRPAIVNTDLTTRRAIVAWCRVLLRHPGKEKPDVLGRKSDAYLNNTVIERVVPNLKEGYCLNDRDYHNINVALGEFCEHARKIRNNERFSPASLLGHLNGISRWFKEVWKIDVNVMTDPVFMNPNTGFVHVANRITAGQQANGVRIQPYNVLSDKDVETLLTHECTNPNTAVGYVNRIIVVVGLILGLRPHAMRTVTWSCFKDELDFEGNASMRYEGIIGDYNGRSKCNQGGLKSAKKIPTSIVLFNENLSFGINPFKMLLEHHRRCLNTSNHTDVFLSPNGNASMQKNFLTATPIGKTHFERLWTRMVEATKIRGIGPHPAPVLHSLRKTLINNLMRAGFTAAEITLRTGHKNIQSVQPYVNIQGETGKRQQSAVINPRNSNAMPPKKRARYNAQSTGEMNLDITDLANSIVNGIHNEGSIVFNFNINKS